MKEHTYREISSLKGRHRPLLELISLWPETSSSVGRVHNNRGTIPFHIVHSKGYQLTQTTGWRLCQRQSIWFDSNNPLWMNGHAESRRRTECRFFGFSGQSDINPAHEWEQNYGALKSTIHSDVMKYISDFQTTTIFAKTYIIVISYPQFSMNLIIIQQLTDFALMWPNQFQKVANRHIITDIFLQCLPDIINRGDETFWWFLIANFNSSLFQNLTIWLFFPWIF